MTHGVSAELQPSIGHDCKDHGPADSGPCCEALQCCGLATAAGEPRYGVTDDGQFTYCLDCGSLVIDRVTHTRFHSILSSHAWTLAVLQNTHLAAHLHDKYDAVERIKRRTFDNWSADALAEVMAEREAPDGT